LPPTVWAVDAVAGGYQPTAEQARRDAEDIETIKQGLALRVDSLIADWFPAAAQGRQFWELGSIDGEPGQSLKIRRTGTKAGEWNDYNAGHGPRGGDMLHLAAHARFGGRMRDAILWAKSFLGMDSQDPARIAQIRRDGEAAMLAKAKAAEADARKRRGDAHHLFFGRKDDPTPLIGGTPVIDYLEGRKIGFAPGTRLPSSFRYRPDVWCSVRQAKHPAMLACIVSPAGAFLGVHRTYLDISQWDHASKSGPVRVVKIAGRGDAKRIWMPGDPIPAGEPLKSHKASLGSFSGGFIPIQRGACDAKLPDIAPGTPVYCAEGIENARSWGVFHPDDRIIAGVSLDNIGNIVLPDQAGPLVLICDNDRPDSDAFDTLERVIERQQERGREVQIVRCPPEYKDMNDWLMGKRIDD
jgi:hypothetical protein